MHGTLGQLHGIKMTVTTVATTFGGYRFPYAKNRSRRVWKKLEKKLGPREIRNPACFEIAGKGLFIHPVLHAQLMEEISRGER